MALQTFKDLANSYQSEVFSDFNRMKLVYAFQDIINPLKTEKDLDDEILSCIANLLTLHQKDSGLMNCIGFDLLESAIKLQLLGGLNSSAQLKDLAVCIAFHSSPKELLIQLNALMSYKKLSNDDQPCDMFINMSDQAKNMFKTVCTFYVSVILQRIEEKHLKIAVQELYIYTDMLKDELETINSVLGSDLMQQLQKPILDRSLALKIHSQHQTLKFLLEIITIYQKVQLFSQYKKDFIAVVIQVFGDLNVILSSYTSSNEIKNISDGVLIIASEIALCESFELPYVLSGIKRFQILLPSAIEACYNFPDLFVLVFSHVVYYIEDNIPLVCICNTYTKNSFKDIFIGLLNLCGGTLNPDIQQKLWKLFKELLGKVAGTDKVYAVREVVKEYPYDVARGLLIDWVCIEFIKGRVSLHECYKLLEVAVEAESPLEKIDTLHASFKLHQILLDRDQTMRSSPPSSNLASKYDRLYKEMSKAYDVNPSIPKLGLLIRDLKELTNHS
jgi:hypothetical protein